MYSDVKLVGAVSDRDPTPAPRDRTTCLEERSAAHFGEETIEANYRMISRSLNCALRFLFALAYPILCRVERTLGLSSNAAMIAVWYDDSVLVVRHSYKSGKSLPGGTIKPGESPKKAAIRELREEVGILARPAELKLVKSWRQRNSRTWMFEYYPAALPRIIPDQREVIAAEFVPRHLLPSSLSHAAKRKC